ncbi:MAG TPA: hypothetical protein VMM38_03450 [Aridibacter sp.]|nr:hypothetical protein [Aridibacter sp.]
MSEKRSRKRLIDSKARALFYPRVQMALILSLTGLTGFATSFILFKLGLTLPWIRYPLAIAVAYAAFLGLLYLWISYHRNKGDLDLLSGIDAPIDAGIGTTGSGTDVDVFSGAGDFGGGGAGGAFDAAPEAPSAFSSAGESLKDAGFDVDLEELGLVLIGLALLVGGLVASLYVVYFAPVLLAEILVDALLVGGLYKRVSDIDRRHWLQTAIRKTWFPALLCATAFGIAGYVFQLAVPEARTLGDVFRAVFS